MMLTVNTFWIHLSLLTYKKIYPCYDDDDDHNKHHITANYLHYVPKNQNVNTSSEMILRLCVCVCVAKAKTSIDFVHSDFEYGLGKLLFALQNGEMCDICT